MKIIFSSISSNSHKACKLRAQRFFKEETSNTTEKSQEIKKDDNKKSKFWKYFGTIGVIILSMLSLPIFIRLFESEDRYRNRKLLKRNFELSQELSKQLAPELKAKANKIVLRNFAESSFVQKIFEDYALFTASQEGLNLENMTNSELYKFQERLAQEGKFLDLKHLEVYINENIIKK